MSDLYRVANIVLGHEDRLDALVPLVSGLMDLVGDLQKRVDTLELEVERLSDATFGNEYDDEWEGPDSFNK